MDMQPAFDPDNPSTTMQPAVEASTASSPRTTPPDKLRVLHICSGKLYGGVETVLVTLARLRHCCPSMEPHFAVSFEGRLSQELADAGAAVHFLGQTRT